MLTKTIKSWHCVAFSYVFLMLSNATWNKAQAQLLLDVGTGTLQNTPTSYPAPFGNFFMGARHQMLVRASELNALGITAGGMTSVGFMVMTPAGIPLQNFTISLGTTTDTVLSTNTGFVGGMTQVYSVPTYTDVVGWNTHVFSQPFFWAGTTNLIIETCFNNTNWVSNGNALVQQTDLGYTGTLVFRQDALGTCTAFPAVGINFIGMTQRPNMRLGFLPYSLLGIRLPTLTSCLNDTSSVIISHPSLTGVANASLRMTYNPDSLTYVGFNSLNPAFSGMTISGGNGVVLMNWGVATNQTIAAGNMVNLRFRVNGSSPVAWDTLTSCEFSDENLNLVPQAFFSGSITQNTKKFTWNRSICAGQSFSLSGQSYFTSGTYQGRLTGTGEACDTLITLNLNVITRQTILPAVTRCSNQPYPFNGLSLTSSGTYFDTLINSLGCDSILQLNLTVNPSYNQNQNIVVCSGTSFAFGGQNLTTSGNYSHTYTTVNGCDSLVNLTLNFAGTGNQVAILASSNTNGFCPGTGIWIGLPNPIPNAFYRWKLNGNILAGANSDTLYATQAGDYQLEIEISPTCTVVSNTLTITVLNCNRVTGDLRYDNTNQTPLAGVPVHLKTLLGNIVASDTTDSAGVYEMVGYANGNYLLDASVNYTWGGVTSADALLVTRVFNVLISMSALRLKAGDVNMTGSTNGTDALLISRRVTGVISSFVAGNFTNNLPSVNALGNPLVANLRVLSTGDVNGSYTALPTAPTLVLDTVIGELGSGTATVRFTSSGSGVFERGICWGTSPNPTVSGNKVVVGSGGYGFTQVFSVSMSGSQLHYARAYARTSSGIFYSNEKTFTPARNVTFKIDMRGYTGAAYTTVNVNGTFNNWCGHCNPMTDANNDSIWEVTLPLPAGPIEYKFTVDGWNGQENLTPGTTCTQTTTGGFTVRVYTVTSAGGVLTAVCWNSCNTCSAPTPTPVNVTFKVDMRGYTGAAYTMVNVNGTFNNWCGACNPMTDANNDSIWEVTLPLLPGTIEYKFTVDGWNGQENLVPGSACTQTNFGFTNRVYLVTSAGGVLTAVCWNSCNTCSTPTPGQPCSGVSTVTDIDGNVYQGIQIGTQCWTQSNLKVSKYRNGDNIPTGLSNSDWENTTLGAYAIYNNDPVNDSLYGKLYNHYAVMDSRGLCPTGWHVPTDGEWNVLVKYLDPNADTTYCTFCGHNSTAGGIMKSTAMQPTPGGWNSPNAGATNSSGFTALAGGGRLDVIGFANMSSEGCWGSSSVSSGLYVGLRFLSANGSDIQRVDHNRTFGFSVRCCRD